VKKSEKKLYPLIEKSISGNQEIETLPAQWYEIETEQSGHCSYAGSDISPTGQNFQSHIQMALQFGSVTVDVTAF